MDQYIYKTFKMLQNGLYWSFYCCSSIGIFIQIVKLGCYHHFAQFYKCQGETSSTSFKWTNHRQTAVNTKNRPPPHLGDSTTTFSSTQEEKKKDQIKVAGSFFFFFNCQPFSLRKAKTKVIKQDLCGREANQGLW